jgi:hypothetical protein
VPDRKPPRLTGDERETLLALLGYQRDSLVRKVTGVGPADARREMVVTGTTLLWLVKHMRRAEITWALRRFGGQEVDVPSDEVLPEDTLARAVDDYRATWAVVDTLVTASDLDQPCRADDSVGTGRPVNLRWVLAHLLEETARHAGHADILRELIDGQTGR